MSPTRELVDHLFGVLKSVGKHHGFTAGLLIGGNEYDEEKDLVNVLNILICTPGRLLKHMDTTPNFDCSQLQVKFYPSKFFSFFLVLLFSSFSCPAFTLFKLIYLVGRMSNYVEILVLIMCKNRIIGGKMGGQWVKTSSHSFCMHKKDWVDLGTCHNVFVCSGSAINL